MGCTSRSVEQACWIVCVTTHYLLICSSPRPGGLILWRAFHDHLGVDLRRQGERHAGSSGCADPCCALHTHYGVHSRLCRAGLLDIMRHDALFTHLLTASSGWADPLACSPRLLWGHVKRQGGHHTGLFLPSCCALHAHHGVHSRLWGAGLLDIMRHDALFARLLAAR
jgi:hypothetical protein